MAFKSSNVVSLNLWIWWVFGCWPKRNSGIIYNLFHNTYGILLICSLYIFYTSTLMLSMAHSTKLEEITASLFISLTLLSMTPKFWNIMTKRQAIWELLDKLDGDEMITEDDEEIVEIVHGNMKKGRFANLLLFNMANVALLSYFLSPLTDLAAKKLPFLAWYGVDHTVTPWYELLYTYQCIGIAFNCLINATMDTFPSVMMCLTVGQLEVLAYKVQQIGGDLEQAQSEGRMSDHRKVARCVEHHNFIAQLVLNIEDIFGPSLFFQFLLSGIVICVTGFQLSVLSPTKDTPEFGMFSIYFLTFCVQAFLPCYFGNEIVLKSQLLMQAAFSSSWVDADLRIQKELIMFAERTKRPLKIYAGKTLELSLQTFSTIINSSYRYYAVLQHMQSTKMAQTNI